MYYKLNSCVFLYRDRKTVQSNFQAKTNLLNIYSIFVKF